MSIKVQHNGTEYRVQFIYSAGEEGGFRTYTRGSGVQPRITEVLLYQCSSKGDGMSIVGEAASVAHRKEPFIKAEGRYIAFGRLLCQIEDEDLALTLLKAYYERDPSWEKISAETLEECMEDILEEFGEQTSISGPDGDFEFWSEV